MYQREQEMKIDLGYINPLCRNCEFKEPMGCGRINIYNCQEHADEYIYEHTISIDGLGIPTHELIIKWCDRWSMRDVEYIERMKNERVY